MKKVIVILILTIAVFVLGCREKKPQQHVLPAKIEITKGEWKVVNVNCLDVMAEKESERRIFRYHTPSGYTSGVFEDTVMETCKRDVKPGWIIQVESVDDYAFFPPESGEFLLNAKPYKTPSLPPR